MDSTGKYKIVIGITTEYKINPQNPKYVAKFVNDNILCLGYTEEDAIDRLKKTYDEFKVKNKLFGPLYDKVLNPYISTEKFEKYFRLGISMGFFDLIGEDTYAQIDDEYTVKEFHLSKEQIALINSTYELSIQPEDLLVDIFEQIEKKTPPST